MIQIDTAKAKQLLQSNDLNELQEAAMQWRTMGNYGYSGGIHRRKSFVTQGNDHHDDHEIDPVYQQQIYKLRILLQSRIVQVLVKNDNQQSEDEKNKAISLSYYDIGNIWMEIGDTGKAVGQYSKSIEYQGDYIPAHIGISDAYSNLMKTDDAIRSMERAIELQKQQQDSNDSSYIEDLCLSYVKLGEIYERAAKFDKCIETLQLSATLLQNWLDENNVDSDKIKLEIKSMIYSHLGTVEEKIGHYSAAIVSLTTAVEVMNICYGPDHYKTQETLYLLEMANSLSESS